MVILGILRIFLAYYHVHGIFQFVIYNNEYEKVVKDLENSVILLILRNI